MQQLNQRSSAKPYLAVPVAVEARSETFDFIRRQFCNHFSAVPEDDADQLVEFRSAQQQIELAFGVRFDPQEFFVRHYLGSIVPALREAFGGDVHAGNVVELSHLAAARPGVLAQAAPLIVEFCRERGARYLVCTASEKLQRFFRCRALETKTLAVAQCSRLPLAEQDRWGSYYQSSPLVMAGDLQLAESRLKAGAERRNKSRHGG